MTLTNGTRVGPYEIVSAIGAGGMGEVYRARDTKLGRDVAIKVLPSSLTSDPDRLARFTREAQVLASLNHPNIAAIYHVEDADGAPAIVMELVEGETLADRVARGAIPIDEALPIAKQIAEALEAAHEQGIIHRDLKPANIKVTVDGNVKVLDFGLAKLAETSTTGTAGGPAALSLSPTITSPAMMTGIGVLLGTAAYMAPEQAKGRPADKRSDIWAFGCVLYETLTGASLFAGESVAETLAFVLTREPEWSSLPASLPDAVIRLLRRALVKNHRDRLPEIAVARFEIADAMATPQRPPVGGRSMRSRLAWAAAAVVALAMVAGAIAYVRRGTVGGNVYRTTVMLFVAPERPVTGFDVFTGGRNRSIAISPNGRVIAFIADNSNGGAKQLWVRPLDSLIAQPLAGTDGADTPFWSPDSRTNRVLYRRRPQANSRERRAGRGDLQFHQRTAKQRRCDVEQRQRHRLLGLRRAVQSVSVRWVTGLAQLERRKRDVVGAVAIIPAGWPPFSVPRRGQQHEHRLCGRWDGDAPRRSRRKRAGGWQGRGLLARRHAARPGARSGLVSFDGSGDTNRRTGPGHDLECRVRRLSEWRRGVRTRGGESFATYMA
jgi:hypothetical protein